MEWHKHIFEISSIWSPSQELSFCTLKYYIKEVAYKTLDAAIL